MRVDRHIRRTPVRMGLRVLVGLVGLLWIPLVAAAVDTAGLTRAGANQASAVATYKSYNRVTKVTAYDVEVRNVSGAALTGPVYLVLESLSGAGVVVTNAAGTTVSGAPYYVVSSSDLAVGAVVKPSVTLSNPSNVRVTFNTVVYLSPPQLTTVPSVVGQTASAATTTLQGVGLVANPSHANSATVPAGQVVSQNPAGGARVAPGSAVAIVISDGPQLVTVPDVAGQTESAATTALQNVGLAATSSHAYNATVPAGRVISQNPTSGAQVAPGSAVVIVVSDGPQLVTVPDVVGQTESASTTALQSVGLVASSSRANSATVPAGQVISQNPASGAQVAPSSSVAIVISDGPATTQQPLTVVITSPATLITVGSTPLSVAGTVSDRNATLTINGAPLSVSASGAFQGSVALTEGHNTIIARAMTSTEESTATISVSLDMTPPYLTVESPAEGATVTTNLIAVSGLINDIVRGTVSEGQANVTVNGVPASVANRTYLAENIQLVEGLNTLTIRGSDQVGNTSAVQSTVTYRLPSAKHIELASGQSQEGRIRSTLAQPLRVRLLDETGGPAGNRPVVFRVTQGDGEVGVGGPEQGPAVLVQTDATGFASTPMRLGTRAGDGNNAVTAKAVGFDGQVDFYASAKPNPGNKVSVNSGNNQRGAASQPLPLPFVVVVTDDGSNVIAGAQIGFAVTQGGGRFQNGAISYTATTDSDGRASATLTLGSEVGLDQQRATATLVGTALYAGLTASALTSGDPGQTSISGVVLDNQDHPLPLVTVRVDGTTRQATTNAQGQFRITEVPVGPVRLIADGSTTTAPGEWPTLPYNLVTVAGAENPLPAPIYMVKLDSAHAVWVGNEDKTITVAELPGFALTVKKNSVTFPNGDREGYVSVTPVNASKVPMPPPNGMQPQLIVTIQPTGARFDPPAPLQLPNVDGHSPGAEVEMYSFDHDLEEFVSIGLGTVSADGTVIKSNLGVGVIKAGWHCGSSPTGGGCTANCGPCEDCNGNCNCVPKPGTDDAACCAAVLGGNADLGAVACCRGRAIPCVDPSRFPTTSNSGLDALNVSCARAHEASHASNDVSCAPTDCKTPGVVPPSNQNTAECSAYNAQLTCLDQGMHTLCGSDPTCFWGLGGLPGAPPECACKQRVLNLMDTYRNSARTNYGCPFL